MNYLLDTCVLSEFTRRQLEPRVIDWLDSIDEEKLFISVITIGEIQRGIERLPDSHCKTELLVWMNTGLLTRFAGRMVALDAPTMFLWGSLVALQVLHDPAHFRASLSDIGPTHHITGRFLLFFGGELTRLRRRSSSRL
jgi:predicted nucleic acid-binding protein